MNEGTITMPDGRTVGFADYGTPDQAAVLWCHGGPGCRFEPGFFAAAAARAGLRLVGIDRPGYGQATPPDRLADGRGWHDFDVAAITCPVVVLHGGNDMLIPWRTRTTRPASFPARRSRSSMSSATSASCGRSWAPSVACSTETFPEQE